MPKEKDIKVEESSFESALNKLDTLHSSMESTRKTFSQVCEDLLEDWEGIAAEQGAKNVTKYKERFQTRTDDVGIMKGSLSLTQQDFNNSDAEIAQGIDEKTVITVVN